MSNQDIEGNAPAEEGPGPPAGGPANLEQELAKERDARVLMRDRLRNTEALAAESHALRSRMADELARVTADRDRLRNAASSPSTAASASASGSPLEATVPLHSAAARPMTPRATEWPLDPPPPPPPSPPRSGPWGALAMLGGLAVLVGAAAWVTGAMPGRSLTVARDTSQGTPAAAASTAAPTPAPVPAERLPAPAAATVLAGAAPTPANALSGAVALPPLTPEAQLSAAPTAAGPAPAVAPTGLAARVRKALDGEGIGSPVEIDSASGHVMVADPQSDYALRDRTDMLIRAVYAGASLPEPQIEHRWLSPRRAGQPAPAAAHVPAPAPAPAPPPAPAITSSMTPAQAYAARHPTQDRGADHHGKSATAATVAEAEELRPVLPEGRVTANCRSSLAGKVPHRADMTACMKSSCCSAGNGQAEDCRAYQKAYPFACGAG